MGQGVLSQAGPTCVDPIAPRFFPILGSPSQECAFFYVGEEGKNRFSRTKGFPPGPFLSPSCFFLFYSRRLLPPVPSSNKTPKVWFTSFVCYVLLDMMVGFFHFSPDSAWPPSMVIG